MSGSSRYSVDLPVNLDSSNISKDVKGRFRLILLLSEFCDIPKRSANAGLERRNLTRSASIFT